jgi:trehalose 6-phosphate phosphatase
MALDLRHSGSSLVIDELCWTASGPVSGLEDGRRVPPHLFDEWPGVRLRLRSAERIILLLDFDGTLTPIRNRPTDVTLDPSTRSCLERLAKRPEVAVSIITGRRRSDVHRRVGLPGIEYLGVHGWEGRDGHRTPTATLRLMRQARRFLEPSLSGLPGIWIEAKGPVLAVHYRNAKPAGIPWARIAVRALIRVFEPALRVVSGKKVWEILPRHFPGKGGAVQAILAGCPAEALPICVGDDAADEPVFRVLEGGITVRVGRKARTYAQYRLAGPSEVREFLRRIDTESARRPRAVLASSSPLLT